MSLREALDISSQIAAGVSAAHALGIIHRDLKPENVIVRPDGLVKVVDFGLAKLALARDSEGAGTTHLDAKTDPGSAVGTIAYMSPEQARAQEVDARTDIWSLGVVLYEMVAGRSPFAGQSSSEVLAAILEREPATLARFDPAAPQELQRIVTKTLRKDRSQRYQTVQDLWLDLQALRDDLQSHARSGSAPVTPITTESAGSGSSPTVGPVPSRTRRGWIAVAATVLILGVVAGVWVWRTARLALRPVAPTAAAVERHLSRLTFAPGLQTDVTFSPDGRFIAYASDQGGNFDIWVQPAAGGRDPVQVTKSPAADTEPDWSPDGGQIVFRSERDGGGLYVVSALGGPERRLAAFGVRPKWSPDGSRVLFASAPAGGAGAILFVVGLDGLPPQRVLERFTADMTWLYGWAWHPDGRRVSMVADTRRREDTALYTVPLDGSSAIITSLPSLQRLGDDTVRDFSWAGSGAAIYFELSVKFVSNLWRLDIDAGTLKAGSLVQLTAGAGQDTRLAVSRDGSKIAFTTKAESIRIWSYRLDPVTGRVTGDADPVTDPTMALPAHATLAPDGRRLAYAITGVGTGRWELWTTDVMTGQKHLVSRDNHERFDPHWSRDGRRLVYYWGRGVGSPTGAQSRFVRCPSVTRRCCPDRDNRACSPTTGRQTETPFSPPGSDLGSAAS